MDKNEMIEMLKFFFLNVNIFKSERIFYYKIRSIKLSVKNLRKKKMSSRIKT